MFPLRKLSRRFPAGAFLIIAAAMIMRFAVPSGYMPVIEHGRIVIAVCIEQDPAQSAMSGETHGIHGHAGDDVKPGQPCAFSGLSLAALGPANIILLALALVFIMATGRRLNVPLAPQPSAFLRPPLRGPPAIA